MYLYRANQKCIQKLSKISFLKSYWNIIRYISNQRSTPTVPRLTVIVQCNPKIRGTIDWWQFTRFVCTAHIYFNNLQKKVLRNVHFHPTLTFFFWQCASMLHHFFFCSLNLVQLNACKVLLCHVNVAFCAANWKISVEI